MNLCKNHPEVAATAKCLTCHLPICDECQIKVKDVGVFCSEACAKKYQRYEDTYGEKLKKARRHKGQSIFTSLLKFIIIVVILIGAAWAISKYVFGYELTELISQVLG